MKKFCVLIFIFFILTVSFFLVPGKTYAAVCPADTDTKTNPDTSNPPVCYSNSDPLYNTGFNTLGGARSCGPVRCPGDTTSPYNAGHTCIVQVNGQCFAGTGASGFDAAGCTQAATVAIPCPKPMDLTIKVQDDQGKAPTSNVTFVITYADNPPGNAAGKPYSITTDTNGMATVSGKLYSGDHFIIVPNDHPNYTFNPPQIGSKTDINDQEMNTISSCGTALENGQTRPPCLFTLKPKVNLSIVPDTSTTGGTMKSDLTVFNAETSVVRTLGIVAAVAAIAFGINVILGLGKSPK